MESDKDTARAATIDLSALWAPLFHALGLPPYQVRVEERMVCISAPPADIPRLLDPAICVQLISHGQALGYRFVTLDLG